MTARSSMTLGVGRGPGDDDDDDEVPVGDPPDDDEGDDWDDEDDDEEPWQVAPCCGAAFATGATSRHNVARVGADGGSRRRRAAAPVTRTG